jgi:hypothetical protein
VPYYCLALEEQTDRRWRRDWRIVKFRLEQDDRGVLKWRRWSHGGWYSSRFNGRRTVMAVDRAAKEARAKARQNNTPVFVVVHGSKLTTAQAKRLTGIKDRAAWDYVHDQDHPIYDATPAPPELEPAVES